MRTVPSRRENKKCTARAVEKKKGTVPSRRGRSYIPPCPVVKTYMHRPVRSSEKIYTVPSRRDSFYLPSHPVVTIITYRPVPS